MPVPEDILLQAAKPARYIGNEIHMIQKDPSCLTRFAFCFPDVYEIGMSCLGLSVIYHLLNERGDTYCERAFSPWPDMEDLMRLHSVPLFALETGDPLKAFDFIGFTLQYELSFCNVLNMLDLSGIAPLACDRSEHDPIVCAGGPCVFNPEPMSDFIDFFYVGEAESHLGNILDIYNENKGIGKTAFLEKILSVPGVYVPRFYDVSYHADGTIARFAPNHPLAPCKIKKTLAADLNATDFSKNPLVPLIEVTQDRAILEVFRGCIRGCRFCQAGYISRPVRERAVSTLIKQADEITRRTGHEEISLVSLSTSDYSDCTLLISRLADLLTPRSINISLPSLRVDAVNLDLMAKTREVRKGSLTFAPEAGSQRMRDAINKGLTEEEILLGCKLAFEGGWNKVKLYFMIGLPKETDEDILAIPALAEKIVSLYRASSIAQKRPLSVNLSVACFVPKPFTPFQWFAQDSQEMFAQKQLMIKKNLHKHQIKYSRHDADAARIEAVLARGDRRLGRVIMDVWRAGANFESWTEHFSFALWEKAFAQNELDMDFYASRERSRTEILPWDHIDIGLSKDFFIREWEKAEQNETTANCRDGCGQCGLFKTGDGCLAI